jgi:type IV fimbrial biogenesis protein FimT
MRRGSRGATSGFTLIEMLVVIAISAILLAVGVPSFSYMIDRNRVAGEVNQMLADLALTRSEALARRTRVVMCRSANPTTGGTCDGAATDWNSGWVVFVDDTTAGVAFQRDAAEPIIRAYMRTSQQVALTATPALAGITVTADGTVFLLDGTPIAGGAELRIDFSGNDSANSRSLCISTTGRARISTTFGLCA